MSLRINADDLRKALNRRGKVFRDEVDAAFKAGGIHAVNVAKQQAKGRGVQDRSNDRADSFDQRIIKTGSNAYKIRRRLEVFSAGVPYARIQEKGGTVRPVRAKWLTIPLPPAKTGKGVQRGPARSFDDLFFYKSRKGNALLGRRLTSGQIENFFLLKKRVKLKARLGFAETWERDSIPFLTKRLRYAVHQALS